MSQGMIPPSGRSDGSIPPGSGGAYATGSSPPASSFMDSPPTDNSAIPVMGTDGMARVGRYVKGDPQNEQLDMPKGVQQYLQHITKTPQREIMDARKRDVGPTNRNRTHDDPGAPRDPLTDVRQKRTMLRELAVPDMGSDGMARSGYALHNPQQTKDLSVPKGVKLPSAPVSNRGVPPMLAAIQQLTGGNGSQPQQSYAPQSLPQGMGLPGEDDNLPTVVTSPPSPQETANLTSPTGMPPVQIPSGVPPPVVSSGSPILDAISSFKKTMGF